MTLFGLKIKVSNVVAPGEIWISSAVTSGQLLQIIRLAKRKREDRNEYMRGYMAALRARGRKCDGEDDDSAARSASGR